MLFIAKSLKPFLEILMLLETCSTIKVERREKLNKQRRDKLSNIERIFWKV